MNLKTVLIAIMGIALSIVGLNYLLMAMSVSTAPSRVVSETVKTGNIIGSYESFFDLKAGYDGRVAQIASLKKQVDASATLGDRRYAQVDLEGTRQACRTMALRYNADTAKLTRGAFKDNGLPDTLDVKSCEE